MKIVIDKRGDVTNGDVIKAMFPDAEIFIDETFKNCKYVLVWFKDSKVSHDFNWNWWNSPYKECEE